MRHPTRKYLSTAVALFAVTLMACDSAPTELLAPELAFARGGPPTTVEDCPVDLAAVFQALCASVDAGEGNTPLVTFQNDRSEFGLITKVGEADDKLAVDKVGDAIQKIRDFRATIVSLDEAAKPKIEGDVAAVLALADQVIAALEAMLAT